MTNGSSVGLRDSFVNKGQANQTISLINRRNLIVLLAVILSIALLIILLSIIGKNTTKAANNSIESVKQPNEAATAKLENNSAANKSNASVQVKSDNTSSSNTSSTSVNVNGETYQTNATNYDKTISNGGSTVHISQHSSSSGEGGSNTNN